MSGEPDVLDATIDCPDCEGTGRVEYEYGSPVDIEPTQVEEDCEACGGTGRCRLGNLEAAR